MRAMRTIGILGGMSWESSILYERIMNTEVRRRLGGTHSADLLVRSYDFAAVEALQEADDWDGAGALLAADAAALEAAGADLMVLATNTMHRVADHIEAAITVPFLHLADTTADAVKAAGVRRVALLGTRYTMEADFYRGRLERHGLDVVVPDATGRALVHRVIYEELVRGIVDDDSRSAVVEVVAALVADGATGVIAGCTEIELLLGPDDLAGLGAGTGAGAGAVAWFPTAELHALAAVDRALA